MAKKNIDKFKLMLHTSNESSNNVIPEKVVDVIYILGVKKNKILLVS